jgi:hypothetical protein
MVRPETYGGEFRINASERFTRLASRSSTSHDARHSFAQAVSTGSKVKPPAKTVARRYSEDYILPVRRELYGLEAEHLLGVRYSHLELAVRGAARAGALARHAERLAAGGENLDRGTAAQQGSGSRGRAKPRQPLDLSEHHKWIPIAECRRPRRTAANVDVRA